MRWYELCENPSVYTDRYSEPPDLDPFQIRDILFGYGSMRISGELPFPPNRPRDPEPNSVARLHLTLWPVTEFYCHNDLSEKVGTLELRKVSENHHVMKFVWDDGEMTGRFEAAMIEGISVYSPSQNVKKRKSLLSWPNVWNSCLLTLRSMGFELKLSGNPDPNGTPDYCEWLAKKDNLALRASNPIELMGLAGLSECATKDLSEDYWWRVDGENIVRELTDEWYALWFPPDKMEKS